MPLFSRLSGVVHEEVRAHPSRGAVSDVTPQERKERAKAAEFRVFEFIDALRAGTVPSNDRLLLAIDALSDTLATNVGPVSGTQHGRLSADGRALVADVDSMLQTLRAFITTKNDDEVLQKLVFHATLAARAGVAPVDVSGTGEHARSGADAMYSLLRLLLTNAHFRGMLADMVDIMRDMYGDSFVTRVKETITGGGSSERSPPWHSRPGTTMDRDSVYEGAEQQHSRRTSMRTHEAAGFVEKVEVDEFGRETLVRETVLPVAAEPETRDYVAEQHITTTTGPIGEYEEPVVTRTLPPERKVYKEGYGRDIPPPSMYETTSIPPPPESTMRSRRTTEGTAYVSEHYETAHRTSMARDDYRRDTRSGMLSSLRSALPEPHRRRLGRRVHWLLRDLGENREYHDAIEYLITSMSAVAGATTTQPLDANAYAVGVELKRLLERMANTSMRPLLEALYRFTLVVRSDPHLRDYLHELRAVARRAAHDPTYLEAPEYSHKMSVMLDRGRDWARIPEARALIQETLRFTDALQSDRVTSAMVRDVSALTRTLAYDDQGRATFKSDLANDFRAVFLPMLVAQIKYIALPRVEHRDGDMDLILENVILTSTNFLPNVFVVEMLNRAVLSPRTEIDDQFSHIFTISASQIQADLHDVSWYYKKKTGLARIKDFGVAQIVLAGEGIGFHVTLEYDPRSETRTLAPLRVAVTVDDLRVTLHHTAHDTMYKLATPAIRAAIKRTIITTLESVLLDWIDALDVLLTRAKATMPMIAKMAAGRESRYPSFIRRFVPGFIRRNAGSSHYPSGSHHHMRRARSRSRGRY